MENEMQLKPTEELYIQYCAVNYMHM